MYLSVYLPSTWALSLFTNIKDSSVSFISFFFFSFSHVKLRILYCQVLCADFLNELCNEPKSVAWGISRVDFFLMIEWNLLLLSHLFWHYLNRFPHYSKNVNLDYESYFTWCLNSSLSLSSFFFLLQNVWNNCHLKRIFLHCLNGNDNFSCN